MQVVQQHIATYEARFEQHPFFAELRAERPVEEVLAFAPRLGFWTLVFQDVLRLNARKVKDPALGAVVRAHAREDAGHDRWFLEDVTAVLGAPPSAALLFDPGFTTTRDATYAIVSEVFRAHADALRLVLVQVLESTGGVFFTRLNRYVAARGLAHRLRYFGHQHLHAEQDHEMHADGAEAAARETTLDGATRAEALALVDRTYSAFFAMFDGLLAELRASAVDALPRRAAS